MTEFQGFMLLGIASTMFSERLSESGASVRALGWQVIAAVWMACAIITHFWR